MSNFYTLDGATKKLEKENRELKAYKEHIEKAYKELQAERDALAEENQTVVSNILGSMGD